MSGSAAANRNEKLLHSHAINLEDGKVTGTAWSHPVGILVFIGINLEFAFDRHGPRDKVGRLARHHFNDHAIE